MTRRAATRLSGVPTVQGETRKAQLPQPTTFRSPDGNTRFRPHNGRYTDRVARKICERIMMGESLREISDRKDMPGKRTIVRWLGDPRLTAFREMYYYARRVQAEIRVDEIFEIADDSSRDFKPKYDSDGEIVDHVPDNEAIQRSRVRIDTRKWYASKMVPRLYGQNSQVELDVGGELAELLKKAANKDTGLPPPIEGEQGD